MLSTERSAIDLLTADLHYDERRSYTIARHYIAERRAQSYAVGRPRDDDPQIKKLHAALDKYIDREKLRELAAQSEDLYVALRCDNPPEEVLDLLCLLSAILRPKQRERIRSPADAAALLMVEMGHLDQEELRVILLNIKKQIEAIVTIYRGSVDQSLVRVSEIYKPAIRRNSAAIIVVHNHPSGEPTPSPEDVLLTRHVVDAGKLLEVECLDHLVIGQGRWISMRERGLGFGR